MHTLPLTAFGVDVDVHLTGEFSHDLARLLAPVWSRCARDNGGTAGAGGKQSPVIVTAHADHPEVIEATAAAVASRVTIAAIEARAGSLLMLHAAGLEMTPGRAVALVAASGTGKTTAASTLGREFGYLSDETVAVTFDGHVIAYPKPLSIGEPLTAKLQLSPDEAGLALPTTSTPRLAGIAMLSRSADGPREPVVERLDTVEACVLLAPQVSYLAALPRPLHTLAQAIDAAGGAVRVTYAEAATLATALKALATGQSRPGVTYAGASALADASRNHPDEPPLAVPGRIDDAIFGLHDAAVLAQGTVSYLSPLAALVLHAAMTGASTQAVIAAAVTLFGDAPDADATGPILEIVAELRHEKLLA